jgi:LDH2 family malate/lactate/ureidoglycolate dehydrogenase
MGDTETLSLHEVTALAFRALRSAGASFEQAQAVAEVVTAAEADECHSHGVYRIPGYVAAMQAVVDAQAAPRLLGGSPGIVRIDAGRGFAALAAKVGRPLLVEKTRANGVAALAISNCYHFSALWIDVEPLAELGLAAFACTIGQRRVAVSGGTRPLLGTNPVAFAWPRENAPPFIFDFATSVVARGEIELHARSHRELPTGWAIDRDGEPTTDAAEALAGALLPFGAHKGAALSMMVELLAGALIGGPPGADGTAPGDGDTGPRLGGEIIVAFDPLRIADHAAMPRAEALFAEWQGPGGGRLPSTRRYAAREGSRRDGVRVSRSLLAEIKALM